ncbi:MAG: hypothetical protein WCG47_23110, partial [Dermatophilaceae bacterium]
MRRWTSQRPPGIVGIHSSSPGPVPTRRTTKATIEYRNNHLVRKYAFYYRYDTAEEREALN